MSDNRKAFEIDAEPYGFDLTLADCGCCTYADEATEYRFKGWQAATEQSSKEIERLNKLVSMQAEALKHAQKQSYPFGHLELFEQAISASSSTVAKWEAAHAAKVREELAEIFEALHGKNCLIALQIRATKVKEGVGR